MEQYVSRRQRCWTLLTQMDPVIRLSEGHRSDMFMDLGGLTCEERVMVQAVADVLIIQHPRIHLRESRKRAKGQGKDRIKRGDNSNTRWFQERGKHTGSGKSGGSAHHANLTSVEDYDYYYDEDLGESADAYQAHNDPADPGSDVGEEALGCDDDEENDTGHNDSKVETADACRAHHDPVNPGSDVGEEALDCEGDKKYDMFSSSITLDDASVFEAAELDGMALLADTWDNDLDPELSAHLVQANV